jgi:hypothetical protein
VVPTSPGSNGYFYARNAGVSVTVENDVGSFTQRTFNQAFDPLGINGGRLVGITPLRSPNMGYTASDISPLEMLRTQFHELGQSLDMLINQNPFATSESSADAFMNCVLKPFGLEAR